MGFKRQLFGGYNRYQVEAYIQELENKQKESEREVTTHIKAINVIKEELQELKQREESVLEILLKAKEEAANIIETAKQNANQIKLTTEEEVKEKLETVSLDMQHLESLKHKLLNHETELKSQLKTTIAQYLELIEAIDISLISEIEQEMTEATQNAEELIQTNKKIIVFPTRYQEKEADDIPVYTFDMQSLM